jgi:very-short-patch-repair endonuclease
MRGLDAIEAEIHRLAARQHGLVARRQLLVLGLGEDAIDHRIASGRLIRLERGVYALGHVQLRREATWLAAVLAARGPAVVSHRTAAGLWGLRPPGGTFVEITVVGHGGVVRRGGRRIHRTVELPATDVTIERGVPATTVARTLLDLAAVVPPHHLRRAVERAEQAELFDLVDVQRVLAAHPRRAGRRALVALLADFQTHGDAHTRSDLEARLLQICLDAGLPRPQVNRHDGVRESDFRWPRERLVVEVDSWTFHGRTRQAFDHDRARDRALLRDGWRVARFTDRQIRADPTGVLAEIRALIAADGT